ALVYALLKYEFLVLYPVNPKQLARFRETLTPSGAKDDPSDARLLLKLLETHRDCLRPWLPEDPKTRLIRQLVEDRRALVDRRTRLVNTLKSRLKQYYPLALQLHSDLASPVACALLLRCSSLEELQQADPQEITDFYQQQHCFRPVLIAQRLERIAHAAPLVTDPAILHSGRLCVRSLAAELASRFEPLAEYDRQLAALTESHPDGKLFRSFPGAGPALAPRLLAAFGADRERIASAEQMQSFSGIAPVTVKSGKQHRVQRRWACNKFLLQTFHEFACHSIRFSAWAQAYYDMMIARGKKRPAAIRALAFKWIRILFRCWKSGKPYDEASYFQSLYKRQSPLLK
ncbi:transposase, partial [Limnoraphis robusta CCNP1324]|uniref:IS110 family transposase n=1 Tax=Limnoraphis robusta TaxID=1118279 RepID=UPI002B20F11F